MPSQKPDDPPPQGGHRIAKLLARAGIASRREIERMIAEGRIALNGVAMETAATVIASLDGVTVDGEPVAAPEPTRLFLFHKPAGVLTAERDFSGRPTIYDRLPKDLPRTVPIGRLDLNTEGLLLMTTDGAFKRELELPSTGVERAYRARAYGQVTQDQLESLIEGVEIDGVRYGSIDANIERRTGANLWIEMVLTEGKNREVRRVLEYLGLRVSRLIRTRYGPFILGDLPPGEVGEVRQGDLTAFRQTLGKRTGGTTLPAIKVSGAPVRSARAAGPVARPRPTEKPKPAARPARARPATTGPGVATPKPAPTHGRETRDELDTRRPRDAATDASPRPARPVRKAGWAKPKIKPGPKRPARKPRG